MTSPPQTAAWFLAVELLPKALMARIAAAVSSTDSRVGESVFNEDIIVNAIIVSPIHLTV